MNRASIYFPQLNSQKKELSDSQELVKQLQLQLDQQVRSQAHAYTNIIEGLRSIVV